MADNRTMAQLLQAPTEGYEDAIVILEINANFELKHDTFYNALNANDQDSLNYAAGENFLDKMPRECLRIIETKSKVRNSRNKAVVAKVSSNSSTPRISPDVAALTTEVGSDGTCLLCLKNLRKARISSLLHAISIIDFSKDEPFSGSTTNHSDALPPSSSLVKTSDNLKKFADELALLKKGVHEENFQVYSIPLFEFDDNFNSSNENPLFNKIDEDVECSDPEDEIDEIDAFLAMEVSSNFEEGYFDSEGDIIFLENLLSDDTTHNLASEVIPDHEPKQNESIHDTLITFSSKGVRMTLLCEISTSRSQENVHTNPSLIIESLPVSLIPVEDSDPVQEDIDIFLVSDDLIPPGVENDDSEDEDNELPNFDHQGNPSSPHPPSEPPNVCLNFKPDMAMKNDEYFNQGEIEDVNSFTFVIWTFLPYFTYPEDSPVILSLRSEDLVFDPDISTFHFSLKTVPFAPPKDE
ncbi:hypothetical protein Tco_0650001 [Tanacetum coccineum]